MPTFPGVYPQIIDNSFQNGAVSRFTACLFGITERGAFNDAVSVTSIGDYSAKFGQSIAGSFLAQAVAAATNFSDGISVVRIGRQYVSTGTGTGTGGAFVIATAQAPYFSVNDYVRARQPGLDTTVNAKVLSVGTASLTLVSVGSEAVALADTYTGATLSRSVKSASANEAEAFIYAPTYGTTVTAAGTVIGTKSAYEFTISGSTASITVGDVLKIEQANRSATREARVSAVLPDGTIKLMTSTDTETGIQAVTLQDNYTAATIKKMTDPVGGGVVVHFLAESAGTWANTLGTAGLTVQVMPGTAADTKKLLVYQNGALVETIDSLSLSTFSDTLAGSSYIRAFAVIGTEPPSNTRAPWNTLAYASSNTATFAGGANGANVDASDYVGTVDPVSDSRTGIKVVDDASLYDFSILAAPGVSLAGVLQELQRVARNIKALAIVDIPDNLNAYEAIDWHNAQGLYSGTGSRIDSFTLAYYWNWFQTTNIFTGEVEWQPPTVGVLGDMAQVFEQFKPWFATAGEVRGRLNNASAVRYSRVSEDAKQAFFANGNCVNPILFFRGRNIYIYGDRTSQRVDSKMTAIHTVNLVNYIVKSLSIIGRKYVFDPNDSVLLDQIRLEYTAFLDTVQAERGLEAYQLTIDSTNNTAATRNARNVIVDLAIIPTDVMERLFINVSVNQSGAQLNAVS